MVDTPHCYNPNMNDEKVVHIPGATHLLVEFDKRCYSDRGYEGRKGREEGHPKSEGGKGRRCGG